MTRLITVPLNRPNGHDPVIYRASLAASGFDEWVFTHRNYPAGPWLLLNRQSLRDDTLDQLLIDRWSWSSDGMERTLRELYSRFHLDPSRVGSVRFGNDAGPIRQAITISDLKVYRYRPKTGENIADPRHRIWASDIAYNTHKQGTALYERDAIIGGLGSVLKARWERFGIYNEVFYSYSLTGRNLIRMGAFFTGVHEGATQLLKALGDMGSLVITLVDGAIDASLTFAGHLAAGDTEAIINGAVKAGLSVANGIDGVKRALQEAYELLQLVLSTPDIGYALYCYLDGLLESIPHTDKFKLAGQAGFAIGLEVLLFFASGGIANVARWVGQGVTKTANTARMLNKSDFLGPFPMQTLESMLNYARLKKAGKLTGNSEPPVIPIKVGDQKTITGGVNDTQKPVANTKAASTDTPKTASKSSDKNTESHGCSLTDIKNTHTSGCPISMINGEEILALTDFTLDGPLPLVWTRTYRTRAIEHSRGLGQGWAHPLSQQLRLVDNAIHFDDDQGRTVYFNHPAIHGRCRNRTEQLTLQRHSEHHYSIAPSNGLGVQYHFHRAGNPHQPYRLTQIADHFGHQIHITHHAAEPGQPATTDITTGQARLRLTYTEQGNICQIERRQEGQHKHNNSATETPSTKAHWHTLVRYDYNDAGDLIKATDANGHYEAYHFNAHVIAQRTLKSGYRFYFEWDQLGPQARCLRNWGDAINGQPTYDYRFEWDPQHHTSHVTDTRGGRTTYRFNDQGLPLSIRQPEGDTTTYEYNRDGQCTTTIDPQGNREQYRYNPKGHLVSYTNKHGDQTQFVVNAQGLPIAITDPAGHQWHRRYTPQGQLSRLIDPAGHRTDYRYHNGQLSGITNALGHSTTYLWDNHNRLSAVRDPLGNHTRYQYNEQGQLTRIKGPDGQSTHYTYDAQHQCTQITHPNGQHTHYTYTPLGLLASLRDATGRTTTYDYDGLSQVVKRTDPTGRTLHYQYDGERNLTGLVNENGAHYQLAYDLNERLISETGFDGRQQHYRYNRAGQLIASHSQSQGAHPQPLNHTDYQRDAQGQLLAQINSDGSRQHFAYDPLGRLSEASTVNADTSIPTRQLHWAYDNRGLVTEALQDNYRLRYDYNPLGQRISTTLPNGDQLRYQYDEHQQFVGLSRQRASNNHEGSKPENLIQLGRDASGREFLRTLNNQLSTHSHYDPQGRLVAQTTFKRQAHGTGSPATGPVDPISQRHYHYNAQGQLSQLDDHHKGSTHYHYDPLDRLTHINGPTPEHFVFDPANNLLAMNDGESNETGEPQKTKRPSPDQTPGNRLAFQGDVHYRYDEHGNRIEAARGKGQQLTTQYDYNSQQQLIRVSREGRHTDFSYDALGRRSSKRTAEQHTDFYWDGDVLLSEQTTALNQEENIQERLYLHEPGTFKPMVLIENNDVYHYGEQDVRVPRVQDAQERPTSIIWAPRKK